MNYLKSFKILILYRMKNVILIEKMNEYPCFNVHKITIIMSAYF